MSELSEKQIRFTHMVGQLIQWAYLNGYGLTVGCARCAKDGHHMANSLHYEGLAIDLNLFTRLPSGSWRYESGTDAHKPLGEFWEAIGGSWGGRFKDGNHYSLEHEGRK